MIKLYQNYLIKLFLKKIFLISGLFVSLVFILSIFDEISYFKNLDVDIFFPFLLTALNTPSTLFEIFPFIFLISTQFFFLELLNKKELEMLKVNGLNNIKILRIILLTSIALGALLVLIFYQFSSKLQFMYFELKNNYSKDNKYLAVVTQNGLWIKDEVNETKYIISAEFMENNLLKNVLISEFNEKFKLVRIIESSKVDISDMNWVIFEPKISKDNVSKTLEKNISISTHFDQKKINGMFRNLSSLNIFELNQLIKDYEELGYSNSETKSYQSKLYSFPIYVTLMTAISGIVMLNIRRNKPTIFYVISGILMSVIIYYFSYLFNLLGQNEKIPLLASTWLPLFIIMIAILIGLVRINEK